MITTEFVPENAADLAAASAFLELGSRLGLLSEISKKTSSTCTAATATGLPEQNVKHYFEALVHAGLAVDVGDNSYTLVDNIDEICYEAGFVSWAMNANRPFLQNPREYFANRSAAGHYYGRDGLQVAVSSQWMGTLGFYPAALQTICDLKPHKFVDLGAGSARLLIEVLTRFPAASGVALDFDADACAEAERCARDADVLNRLQIIEASIQSVAHRHHFLQEADVIHAGFVFHDMMPNEEAVADQVLSRCREALLDRRGTMALTEVVPFATSQRERRFGALLTYYHQEFMGVELLNEDQWKNKLLSNGFRHVDCSRLRMPSCRLFTATT
jgi:trans-aconitate methyltransferase